MELQPNLGALSSNLPAAHHGDDDDDTDDDRGIFNNRSPLGLGKDGGRSPPWVHRVRPAWAHVHRQQAEDEDWDGVNDNDTEFTCGESLA
jgi:hypothetical protein